MKEELDNELKQTLDALEQHGKNARRQQQLSDLIDQLAKEEKTVVIPQPPKNLKPLWWAIGAAAACLLLWFVIKPADNPTDTKEEQWIAEETLPSDTIAVEIEECVHIQEPMRVQEPMAEKKPVSVAKPKAKHDKPLETTQKEPIETPILAEANKVEAVETVEIEPQQTIIETPNEPLALESQKPTRRVIKSECLVGYGKLEKQPDQSRAKRPVFEDKTIFGQPQDPNMKNGMLAMEIKF